jgi:outer membrane protein assembly factor BamB
MLPISILRKISPVFALFLITIATSVAAQAPRLADTPWPMYQRNTKHTGQSTFQGITSTPTVLWKRQIVHREHAAISTGLSIGPDGTIYGAFRGALFALDQADGSVKWTTGDTLGYGLSSNSTPAIAADGTLYWGFHDSFARFTSAGEILGGQTGLTTNLHFGSSPAIAPDGSVVAVHDALWAFTREGDVRWVYPFGTFSDISPAIADDGTIYTGGGAGRFYAFSPDGTVKWSRSIGGSSSPSIGSDGTIYVGTNGAKLYALSPVGTVKWIFETEETRRYEPGSTSITGPPTIGTDGTLYIGTHVSGLQATLAHFYAVNPDGTLKWKVPIPKLTTELANPGIGSAWIVDRTNNVFGCADNGRCYGFDQHGNLLWEYVTSTDDPDVDPNAVWNRTTPLLIADGVMLIADGLGTLHALADPTLPVMHANPPTLKVQMKPGTTTEEQRSITITSTKASINWSAALEQQTPWLTLITTTGTTRHNLDLRIQPRNLAPGVYTAKIRVSTTAEPFANPILVIPVELTISHFIYLPGVQK